MLARRLPDDAPPGRQPGLPVPLASARGKCGLATVFNKYQGDGLMHPVQTDLTIHDIVEFEGSRFHIYGCKWPGSFGKS